MKDLETELESSKQTGKENLEQALSIERERFTQLQWDMQELRRESMEVEFRLKAEQVCICSYARPVPISIFRRVSSNLTNLRMRRFMLKKKKLQSLKRMQHCG